jgi:hypothetical protein
MEPQEDEGLRVGAPLGDGKKRRVVAKFGEPPGPRAPAPIRTRMYSEDMTAEYL